MEQYLGQALEIFIPWKMRINIVVHLLNPIILACCQQKDAPEESKKKPALSTIQPELQDHLQEGMCTLKGKGQSKQRYLCSLLFLLHFQGSWGRFLTQWLCFPIHSNRSWRALFKSLLKRPF